MQEFSTLDGALLIDKPCGPTSHDVVDAIRRKFGIKKVGHCGTLDPNATGLLIIVLGCGAHLSTLRRVVSGKFDVADAKPLEEVLKLSSRELEQRVIPFLKLAVS